MSKTKIIYGASDNCIEIDGDIQDEFYANDESGDYLAFSDGTVLSIRYTDDGVWRISRVHQGSAQYSKAEADGPDTKNYSDQVTLTGDIQWVVCGSNFKKGNS